jgi:hypothetical protein
MANLRRAGVSEPVSEGERLERARANRKLVLFGALFGAGLMTGFMAGYRDGAFPLGRGDPWPAAMALGILALYLVAVIGGGIVAARHQDEFELQNQYKAVAVGAFVYVIVYPAWFILWMGALAPEPMHVVIYALFILSALAASLFYRFR